MLSSNSRQSSRLSLLDGGKLGGCLLFTPGSRDLLSTVNDHGSRGQERGLGCDCLRPENSRSSSSTRPQSILSTPPENVIVSGCEAGTKAKVRPCGLLVRLRLEQAFLLDLRCLPRAYGLQAWSPTPEAKTESSRGRT